MSTPPDSVTFPSIPAAASAAAATTTAAAIATTNRRSYRCYHCNYSFHITPVPATATSSPTSFRCPQCHQRHLIPHHIVAPPPPPSVPASTPPTLLAYSPQTFTYYTSDESDSDYESDSDNSLLSFTAPSIHILTPALKSFVDSLPIKQFTKDSAPPHQSCSICMECFEIENDSDVSVTVNELPCRHFFHKNCIAEWLNRSNTCPLCRYQLPLDPGPAQNQSEDEYETVLSPEVESLVRSITEEPSPSLALNSGSGNLTQREGLADGGDERNLWAFDAMRDEDGDTLMVDA